MRYSRALLAAATIVAVFVVPAYADGLQPATQSQEHDHEHQAAVVANEASAQGADMMSQMKATDEKLDALVRTMNEAKGAEKTDAIAALLTALVQERRAMAKSMATCSMMTTMNHKDTSGDPERDKSKP